MPPRRSPRWLSDFRPGHGYLIYGPQELIGWPKRDERVDRATGVWGVWMPGFCQFITGVILFVGLTWFQVSTKSPPLYMAALAFTAYGVHWFAIGWNRYSRNDPRPNSGMCVAYMVISAIGATVFFKVGDWPVGLLFLGLFAIYFSDFFAGIGVALGERALGFFHLVTWGWLMYLAYAVTVDFALDTTGGCNQPCDWSPRTLSGVSRPHQCCGSPRSMLAGDRTLYRAHSSSTTLAGSPLGSTISPRPPPACDGCATSRKTSA